jgi:hypothetical protein
MSRQKSMVKSALQNIVCNYDSSCVIFFMHLATEDTKIFVLLTERVLTRCNIIR